MKHTNKRNRLVVHLKPSACRPTKADKDALASPEIVTLEELGQPHVHAGPHFAGFQGVGAITKHTVQPMSYETDFDLIRRKLDEAGATDIQFELVDDGIKVAGIAETAVKPSGGFLKPPWDIVLYSGLWKPDIPEGILIIREAHA